MVAFNGTLVCLEYVWHTLSKHRHKRNVLSTKIKIMLNPTIFLMQKWVSINKLIVCNELIFKIKKNTAYQQYDFSFHNVNFSILINQNFKYSVGTFIGRKAFHAVTQVFTGAGIGCSYRVSTKKLYSFFFWQ